MHKTPDWHTGEAGKFLWESPAKTLAEHHWRYRKQSRPLVTVQRKQNLQFCRSKTRKGAHGEQTPRKEVSTVIAFHARSSKKNTAFCHTDSLAWSSKYIYKEIVPLKDLNQCFQAKLRIVQRTCFLFMLRWSRVSPQLPLQGLMLERSCPPQVEEHWIYFHNSIKNGFSRHLLAHGKRQVGSYIDLY